MRKPRLELWPLRIRSVALQSAIGIVAVVALYGTSAQATDLLEMPSSAPIPKVAEVPPQYQPQTGPVRISDSVLACVTTQWTQM